MGLLLRRHAPRCPHISPCPAGVLNRAEWVKFVALFFNQERAASDIFAALKAEYEATKVGWWCVVLCCAVLCCVACRL